MVQAAKFSRRFAFVPEQNVSATTEIENLGYLMYVQSVKQKILCPTLATKINVTMGITMRINVTMVHYNANKYYNGGTLWCLHCNISGKCYNVDYNADKCYNGHYNANKYYNCEILRCLHCNITDKSYNGALYGAPIVTSQTKVTMRITMQDFVIIKLVRT